MGMAAFGRPQYADQIYQDFIEQFDPPHLALRYNVHRGIQWWRPDLKSDFDIAASIQMVTEDILKGLARWIADTVPLKKFVFGGGVALNCVANSAIARLGYFERHLDRAGPRGCRLVHRCDRGPCSRTAGGAGSLSRPRD